MKKIIPYGKQRIDFSDINEVKKALSSNFITGGNYVRKFEKAFLKYTNAKFAVSCSSGTAAIHIALESINLKKNCDWLFRCVTFALPFHSSLTTRYLNSIVHCFFFLCFCAFSFQCTSTSLLNLVQSSSSRG